MSFHFHHDPSPSRNITAAATDQSIRVHFHFFTHLFLPNTLHVTGAPICILFFIPCFPTAFLPAFLPFPTFECISQYLSTLHPRPHAQSLPLSWSEQIPMADKSPIQILNYWCAGETSPCPQQMVMHFWPADIEPLKAFPLPMQ